MDSCLNSKSAYIFERRYEDLPSGYYDYDVLKYWEKNDWSGSYILPPASIRQTN